jgi:hypothetical protein
MEIHILGSIGQGEIFNFVLECIIDSGNAVTENLANADFCVGMVDDPNLDKVDDTRRRIIFKDPSTVDTVPVNAVLVDALKGNILGTNLSFMNWLIRKREQVES